ncbi:electron transport complex subunit RsxC [Marinobacter daepoensis]|uniref:Ion-translocating oxidoreductase complex subunit C n=1 Tax=Marinobacter daepoensis TaxID=262077 RepID=A0ABS3BIN7_9GAMM|nr:electron transport complex subunit RsxC [Marinobacter daepoensis]MBN7771698.1 electron transport complex subunit RsxC [Marinobacter daepoensis]MBY6080876.1 electron transport complex subunit RsxC [Marinobacter daepoensis]
MTQLWDFAGGIHPPENKHQSTQRPIAKTTLPEYLVLPLQQHIGEPAEPVVSVGDRVLKGQPVAEVRNGMGVPVHAPTSGIVEAIEQRPVPHPSGMSDWCIVIRPDHEDQWVALEPVEDYKRLDREQLLELIRHAGIAGMGGAGFPTDIKLRPPRDRKVDTLILNGAECEPYITADDMTMREHAGEVVSGLEIMAWILRPSRCVIGIEDNKPEAVAAMRQAVEGTQIEVLVIPTKYPSGGEKQLIRILTGQEVPSGGIPADIGVMCQNIGTAVAVGRAVFEGKPLISRIVTITGDAVQDPGNFEVLIGTPVQDLLAAAGLQQERLNRLILGGPMMGYTLTTDNVPLVKTSNCVIAATEKELPAPPPEQPCIRCGQCAEACPMDLLPQQLFWYSKAAEFEKAEHLNLFDCIECGACSYVCPSAIPLVQYYRFAKGEIRTQRAEQLKADRARERFEARQARLDREQQEKDQRRKERAKAAAAAQAKKQAEADNAAADGQAPDDRAAKAALVQQALERKKAKTAAQTSEQPAPAAPDIAEEKPDVDALEKQLTQAEAKLNTMQGMLDDARAQQAENVEKLERAVAKNHDRVQRARQALELARKQIAEQPASSQ